MAHFEERGDVTAAAGGGAALGGEAAPGGERESGAGDGAAPREEADGPVVHPEVVTLHWEGPAGASEPVEVEFPGSEAEREAARAAERERELGELRRTAQGRALWQQIREQARRRGDAALWQRKLHAYWWVKLDKAGTAGDYARRNAVNHATVRTWIADVSRLAYEVGYRLHEDKLLLVGEAPEDLDLLRAFVNRDAASDAAWLELARVEAEFRGRDPYFHLNEGHILRAHGELRASDATLKEGLTIAEARPVRALLWNARGQTFWDCRRGSGWPLADHLERAERAFRRAALLDPTTYFPFVNLAQMAVDGRDGRRAEYWLSELGSARKRMNDTMKNGLARYLHEAEWTRRLERKRAWKSGPGAWIREAFAKGVLPLLAAVLLFAAAPPTATASPDAPASAVVENGGGGGKNSGAGGN